MPNWCSNRLDVFFGNDEEAKRFEEKLGKSGKLSMNAFFPRPEALDAFMEAYSDPYNEKKLGLSEEAERVVTHIGNADFSSRDAKELAPILLKWAFENHGPGERKADEILGEVREILDSATGRTSKNAAEALSAFLEETDGYSHSNDWSSDHWGTKWDLDPASQQTEWDGGHFSASFDTAWAPPFAFCQKLSEGFPEAEISLAYFEPGMGFGGVASFSDGGMSTDESAEGVVMAKEKLGWEEEEIEKEETSPAN